MRLKLTIAYDGSPFAGWQENGMGPSVEGELQRILEQICQHPVRLEAASRTDAGVHALGQVATLDVERPVRQESLNRLLPPPIRVTHLEEVSDEFHPSRDSIGKEYHYSICTGPFQLPHKRATSWHCHLPLNRDRMAKVASELVGERDFAHLTNQGHSHKTTRRHLKRMDLVEVEGGLRIEMEADRFLFRMARNLVGALIWQERKMTVPAHGLTLMRVDYDRTK